MTINGHKFAPLRSYSPVGSRDDDWGPRLPLPVERVFLANTELQLWTVSYMASGSKCSPAPYIIFSIPHAPQQALIRFTSTAILTFLFTFFFSWRPFTPSLQQSSRITSSPSSTWGTTSDPNRTWTTGKSLSQLWRTRGRKIRLRSSGVLRAPRLQEVRDHLGAVSHSRCDFATGAAVIEAITFFCVSSGEMLPSIQCQSWISVLDHGYVRDRHMSQAVPQFNRCLRSSRLWHKRSFCFCSPALRRRVAFAQTVRFSVVPRQRCSLQCLPLSCYVETKSSDFSGR